MDTTDESLPILALRDAIECTEDGVMLVDGAPIPPGRYRLQLDGTDVMPVLTVEGQEDGPEVVSLAHLG